MCVESGWKEGKKGKESTVLRAWRERFEGKQEGERGKHRE